MAKRRRKLSAHQQERWRALDDLGGVCVECGMKDKRCLDLEHKDGDGYLESYGRDGSRQKARGITSGEIRKKRANGELFAKFQVLCANCHRIKSFENRELMGRPKNNPYQETMFSHFENPQLRLV